MIVLDGVGIGALPDAARYGDADSDTLGHVAASCSLQLPVLSRLGLGRLTALGEASTVRAPAAAYGRLAEASAGKDSVTGHWELMGVVLDRPFPVFPAGFPRDVIEAIERRIGRGTLGNCVASGTEIIERLGPEHLRTGRPIVYTSADSVLQIAAHEDAVPLAELYEHCAVAYEIAVEGLGIARVIARPFVGEPGRFRRTAGRRDFARPPVGETLLDRLSASGRSVVAIGKIDQLFAGRGITDVVHTSSDEEGMRSIVEAIDDRRDGLIFANLVDFDTAYGHRNDAAGFAANLERFDRHLPEVLARLAAHDLLLITADHGNDPTTASTDHSREHVPLLVTGPAARPGVDLGTRCTFADVGQTLADAFGVAALPCGTSFWPAVRALHHDAHS